MLAELQTRLQQIVASAPILAGRPIKTEDKGNLVSEVENALVMHAICVVVAPANGNAKPGQAKGNAYFEEDLEVTIHRGLLEDEHGLSTVAIVDVLIPLIHGAPIVANHPAPHAAQLFRAKGHRLIENGDGTFARVITVSIDHQWGS